MIILCLALVALSVLLFCGPAADRHVTARLAPAVPTPVRTTPPRVWWGVGWGVGLLVVGLLQQSAGSPAAVVAAAVLILLATWLRLSLGFVAARSAARAETAVAHACAVLAAQIRVGRVPAEALRGAAQDCPVLAVAHKAQDLGGDVIPVWHRQSRAPGHEGLAVLARAWQISNQTGAPLAHSLEQVSKALTAELALRAVVAGELSAARATGKIMAALPLIGLAMGYFIGGEPLKFLLAHQVGWACLILGVVLAAAGVLWIDKLAQLRRV